MTFLADTMAFWPIATVWGILEQLLAEPLFHPLHMECATNSTKHEQLFYQ